MYFFSLSVHFVCLSGVNAAQTFVSLRRLNHEHFERLNLHTFFYAWVPSRLNYIDTTTRLEVYVDLEFMAGVAEEPNGRSQRFKLPPTL
jgi:hypothetical protein